MATPGQLCWQIVAWLLFSSISLTCPERQSSCLIGVSSPQGLFDYVLNMWCSCFVFRSRHSLCARSLSVVPVDTNCCVLLGFVLRSGLRYALHPSHLPKLGCCLSAPVTWSCRFNIKGDGMYKTLPCPIHVNYVHVDHSLLMLVVFNSYFSVAQSVHWCQDNGGDGRIVEIVVELV